MVGRPHSGWSTWGTQLLGPEASGEKGGGSAAALLPPAQPPLNSPLPSTQLPLPPIPPLGARGDGASASIRQNMLPNAPAGSAWWWWARPQPLPADAGWQKGEGWHTPFIAPNPAAPPPLLQPAASTPRPSMDGLSGLAASSRLSSSPRDMASTPPSATGLASTSPEGSGRGSDQYCCCCWLASPSCCCSLQERGRGKGVVGTGRGGEGGKGGMHW